VDAIHQWFSAAFRVGDTSVACVYHTPLVHIRLRAFLTVCSYPVLLPCRYTQFEYALLQDSVRYFATEGAQLVAVYDTARFLALVDRRLQVGVLGDVCVDLYCCRADCSK
jgi:hypothetical protein